MDGHRGDEQLITSEFLDLSVHIAVEEMHFLKDIDRKVGGKYQIAYVIFCRFFLD